MNWKFWKKEKEVPVEGAKFKDGDLIYFRRRGERTVGYVCKVYYGENHEILYDVQVGGQCPYYQYGLPEDALKKEVRE